jgi:hypothetical protein
MLNKECPLHSVAGFFLYALYILDMDVSQVSQLLKQLLEAHSPEVGARLKQRLNALLVGQGLSPFDERVFGFRKFGDFLQKTQTEILKVDRTASTDIIVSLVGGAASPVQVTRPAIETDQAAIRSDVWQAFTNHNIQRKRFLNKETFAVKHFIENDQSTASHEVTASPDNFIEIQPIPGSEQLSWMREYLSTAPFQVAEKTPLEAMTEQPYTSSLNSAFTRALGEKGDGWRHFRTHRVTEAIERWASQHSVLLDNLRKPAVQTLADMRAVSRQSARASALKLLQLISDEDIAKVVMPVLVTTVLIRTSV